METPTKARDPFRKKLSLEEQLEKLERDGIQFTIMSKNQALRFLQNKNYFFKLKSYIKNYDKNGETGKYANLEFAYLVELSKLDAQLRAVLLELCLSLEHQMKVMLIREITEDPNEDGYTIIQTLLAQYPHIKRKLERNTHSVTFELWNHYKNALPVWIFVELCTYSDFVLLFELYFSTRPDRLPEWKKIHQLMQCSKFLRNASAHNNCLLNSLSHPHKHHSGEDFRASYIVKNAIRELHLPVSKDLIKNSLANPIIHDFVGTVFLFKEFCTSTGMFNKKMSLLYDLFTNRFLIHKGYFEKCTIFTGRYNFVLKFIEKVRIV